MNIMIYQLLTFKVKHSKPAIILKQSCVFRFSGAGAVAVQRGSLALVQDTPR